MTCYAFVMWCVWAAFNQLTVWLTSTYSVPVQSVAVHGYIQDNQGKVPWTSNSNTKQVRASKQKEQPVSSNLHVQITDCILCTSAEKNQWIK